MKMSAAVLREVSAPLSFESVELDPPQSGEVLVRLRASGVCHSDVHYWQGHIARHLPIILGHEGTAEVMETGPGVSAFRPGDRVVLAFLPSCGRCPACLNGRSVFCEVSARLRDGTMPDGTHRIRDAAGSPIDTLLFVSSFAEYSVVPEASLVRLPDNVGWEQGALFGCGFTTGFGAVTRGIRVEVGDSVLVIGCGAVGLAAICGAAMAGASSVVAVDTHQPSLDAAVAVGATHTILTAISDEIVDTVLSLTGGVGADWALESVGGAAAPSTIDAAFRSVRRGGTLAVLGLANDQLKTLPISPLALVTSGRTVRGVLFGNTNLRADIPRYLAMMSSGRLDMAGFVGGIRPFSEVNEVMASVNEGTSVGRTVLSF